MVNELTLKGKIIVECELCGSGYTNIEAAERCEQYCYFHGSPSPMITQKAIHKPTIHPIVSAKH